MASATASPNPKDLGPQPTSSSPRTRSRANSSLPATKKPGLPPIVRAHDIFNLFALAGLNALNVLYLLGRQSPHTLLWASLLYFVVDVLYVGLFPRCVKSPEVIVGHHIVSICLILIPFNQAQFSWCLSYCMLVEFNTWQLIAKRTIPVASQLQEALFYATWVLLRLVWYPYLIWVFYREWQAHSLEVGTQWNLILITPVFQTFLTGLNVHWTWALISKPRERRPKLL